MMADSLYELKEKILEEKKIIKELQGFFDSMKSINSADEIAKVTSQIDLLQKSLKKANEEIPGILKSLAVGAPLNQSSPAPLVHPKTSKEKPKSDVKETVQKIQEKKVIPVSIDMDRLEKETLKRLRKQKAVSKKKKVERASKYTQISNKIFSGLSLKMTKLPIFKRLREDLIRANMQFPQISYISVILFSSLLSFLVGTFLAIFFLFFSVGALMPFISFAGDNILSRAPKVFWIPLALPALTFVFLYLYPSLEKKSAQNKIDAELPFAAIHMSAISGSMVDPSKIFEILVSTKEYPTISREFTKLINEIHIYGYDLVSALKNTAQNSPSKKLSDLLNGLATTITSGGNLPEFFDKRASTLLFDYRIEREKEIRASETFMDIYISLVIAAPMILMLLLMMMKISGLGIQLSTNMITVVMVLGVSTINVFFLMFLILKQSAGGGR
ncbi:type II secretion system F family protein [Candidatus Pacearchaeota archaeon]|nr:type II secretion system F family protein [Candidatus Pacearchaeota archaeon]